MQTKPRLSERWTCELLHRCTQKELLIVVATYGLEEVAARMGYTDLEKFVREKTSNRQTAQ